MSDKVAATATIAELEAIIEWLKESAADKLADVEKRNPGLTDNELFAEFRDEAERALDGITPTTVAATAHRAFVELRTALKTKKSGQNKDHIGGA